MILKISSNGCINIPANIRKKYALEPGSKVVLVDYGGLLSIVPALKNPIEEAAGMLKGNNSLTQVLITEHNKERQVNREMKYQRIGIS